MHLYGRKLQHPENRDQLELCRSLCMWTPNLPLSLVRCPAAGCKLEGQVGCDDHCLLLCSFEWKKKKKAFNINDLVLIVMDTLCRDTLPSRAWRDKLSFTSLSLGGKNDGGPNVTAESTTTCCNSGSNTLLIGSKKKKGCLLKLTWMK